MSDKTKTKSYAPFNQNTASHEAFNKTPSTMPHVTVRALRKADPLERPVVAPSFMKGSVLNDVYAAFRAAHSYAGNHTRQTGELTSIIADDNNMWVEAVSRNSKQLERVYRLTRISEDVVSISDDDKWQEYLQVDPKDGRYVRANALLWVSSVMDEVGKKNLTVNMIHHHLMNHYSASQLMSMAAILECGNTGEEIAEEFHYINCLI
jgi:hypothetical protein